MKHEIYFIFFGGKSKRYKFQNFSWNGDGFEKLSFCIIHYSDLSNKHAANLILSEKIFPPTCLIRTYMFIYFQGKFLPTRLLEYLCLLILAKIPNYKIILSSFKLLFCCFKHFKETSRS